MAELTLEEQGMFAKYYGDSDLVHNDLFWLECLMVYQERIIPLPLIDNAYSRRKLHDLLECPPGKCASCCSYKRVPLSPDDIIRLGKENKDKLVEVDGRLELNCENGCPFLVGYACSVYKNRPDVCAEFPIQLPRESIMNGKVILQITYRLKCEASLKVIRAIMTEACSTAPMLLLPDLSLIPKYKNPLKEITNEKN